MNEKEHETGKNGADFAEVTTAEGDPDSKEKKGGETSAGLTGDSERRRKKKQKSSAEREDSSGQKRAKKRNKKQEAIVEAVLFTMGESVELRQLAAAIESDESEARQAVEDLRQRYDREKRGIQIIELDGCYQMCTRV